MVVTRAATSITLNHSSTFEGNQLTLAPDTNVFFSGVTNILIPSIATLKFLQKSEFEVINCQTYEDGMSSTTLKIVEGTISVESNVKDDDCYFTLVVPGATIQLSKGAIVQMNRYNNLTTMIVTKGVVKIIRDSDMVEKEMAVGMTASIFMSDSGADNVSVRESSDYDRSLFRELNQ